MLPLIKSFRNLRVNRVPVNGVRQLHLGTISEAARKGTREKARQKKVKVEVKKVGFIPHNLRDKDKIDLSKIKKHFDDSWKATPKDNVYVAKYYRWRMYTIEEAVQCHRETHDPTMYNLPNAPLNVEIELNMQAEKQTRFVDAFSRMAMIPHKFDHGENRKILVFTKDNSLVQEAKNAGATLVGGVELIKNIQSGDLLLTDYQHVVAHNNILADLVTIRGLLKRKFPNPKNGTLGIDLKSMIHKYSSGINYSVNKDENQQDYGLITTCIGTLDMEKSYLAENLISLIKDVDSCRPKREGKFITRVVLISPPSSERLKIDPFLYVPESWQGKTLKSDAEDIEEESFAAIN